MRASIIVNGYYESPAYTYQTIRLCDELSQRGIDSTVLKNDKGFAVGRSLSYGDFVIFLDKDLPFARAIEAQGIPVFNTPSAIEKCDSKLLTYVALSEAGLPVPPTTAAPLRYRKGVDCAFLGTVEKEYGYPLIAKLSYGSLGAGVEKINDERDLFAYESRYSTESHLYQKYFDFSRGRSNRIIVAGGKALCGMTLENPSDFRSNADLGGTAKAFVPTKEYVTAAQSAAEALALDYCAVDFLCGEPIILEVNSNAYFSEMERVTGVNVAGAFCDAITRRL